jgi:hypothetical protein
MKPRFCIYVLICTRGSYAFGGDDPTSMVRTQRDESNAAIAAHDAVRLRQLFDVDYHGIQGTSGALDNGGEATGGTWRLKSEAFVTLACSGSSACDKAG